MPKRASGARVPSLTTKSRQIGAPLSTAITETTEPTNPFDARGPFLLSLFMTLVGYSVLVALPAINSAWVDQLGFTEVQVNRVASADLLGLVVTRKSGGPPGLPLGSMDTTSVAVRTLRSNAFAQTVR